MKQHLPVILFLLGLVGCTPEQLPGSKPTSMNSKILSETETATLGGGCFWCLEPLFESLRGVEEVYCAYAGGKTADPSYEEVCGGYTGHAEVIRIHFNPEIITFGQLLEVFFASHDPTTLNRQGNDSGTQYRSVIYYHDDKQRQVADSMIQSLNASGKFQGMIVTEVSPLTTFYKAEAYHQDYFRKNPQQAYCRVVIRPKVEKFDQLFNEMKK